MQRLRRAARTNLAWILAALFLAAPLAAAPNPTAAKASAPDPPKGGDPQKGAPGDERRDPEAEEDADADESGDRGDELGGGAAAAPAQEDLLQLGDAALLDGDFHAAIERFEKAAALAPGSRDALEGLAEAYRLTGRLDEWGKTAEGLAKAHPSDIPLACAWGEYLFERGRLDEAEAVLRAAIAADHGSFRAHADLGDLLRYRGRHEDAEREYRALSNRAAVEHVEDAERLTYLGFAYWRLGGFEEAAEVFSEAQEADRLDPRPRIALGDLFLEKYQSADALKEHNLALKIRPGHPQAILGLALAYFAREQDFSASQELKKVLEIRPTDADALARLARYELEDRRFEQGRSLAERALASNPAHKQALALLATYEYLSGRPEGFAKYERQVLAIDPGYAELYLTQAEVLGGLYRFADGLPIAQKAIAMDPRLWAAYDIAGRFAFNIGEHAKGLEYLKRAQKEDNFRQPWRLNMIEVASIFDEFVPRENEHFKTFIHVDENEVLRGYLEELLENAHDRLTKRYKFVPMAPTIVEVYPDEDDFAVRNVGQVGIDLILGICFGRVVTLNSPHAKQPGFFSWAQTAWHEFAHVITLQLTRARIPRWLTEGISVYEERRENPLWERRQEQELFDAYHNEKVFPLVELNGAFRTPRIGFAYYQGSLLAEFIEKTWGFDALLEILRLYSEDLTTEQILLEVLQIDAPAFDAKFLAFVREKVERFRLLPRYDDDMLERFRERADLGPDDADNLAKLAWTYYFHGKLVDGEAALGRALEIDESHAVANLLRGTLHYDADRFDRAEQYLRRGLDGGAEDAFARLRLGQIYERSGKLDEAIREYERAKVDFPFYVGPGNAYGRLEAIYRARKLEDKATDELRARAELVNTDLDARRSLFTWYRDHGDSARARACLEEMISVDPFDASVHEDLAAIYRGMDRRAPEARELGAAIALAKEDAKKVELLQLLAEAELTLGRQEDARFHLEEAIRLAPDRKDLRDRLEAITSS